jgi:CheY-like chemotaxis protein
MRGFLITDDSPTIRRMLSSRIKSVFPDVAIFEALNGKEALHVLTQNSMFCIITDLDMGDFGGEEFVEKIKSNKILKKKHVIVFSSKDYTPKHEGVYFVNKNEGSERLIAILKSLK